MPTEKDVENGENGEKDTESVETKEVQEAPTLVKPRDDPRLVLDQGQEHVRVRKHWWQQW